MEYITKPIRNDHYYNIFGKNNTNKNQDYRIIIEKKDQPIKTRKFLNPTEEYISKNLIDFVTCKIRRLSPTENIAIYGDGKLKFFDNDGNITKTSVIEYNGNEAGYSEITENEIWAPIPNGNTVVNYSLIHNRI